ncbi:MAG: M23 family metallopeptidase [Phycisphaerales bacterium]|nr:M23 family metallopeptidase [Hyphomonadaceae bacterium]
MMKRPRTVFAPFALVACVAIGLLFTQAQQPQRAPVAPLAVSADVISPDPKPRLRAHAMRKPLARTQVQVERRGRLIIPVEGFARANLTDTFGAARSEGRSHLGIDIMAAAGTPVLAAADGEIAKLHDSERGGLSIYQFDRTGRLILYYAHLESRAPGLEEGRAVRQGDIIGYVGMTGNASTPHLHFEIQHRKEDRSWWRGQAVNPYPHLRSGQPPARLEAVVAAVSESDEAR